MDQPTANKRAFILAVTTSKMLLGYSPKPQEGDLSDSAVDVISEIDPITALEKLNQSETPIYVEFSTGNISKGTGPFELEEEDNGSTAKCYEFPGLVGVVSLGGSGNTVSERGIPHLTIVTKRRRVGSVAGSAVFVVEQVAVLPCNSATECLVALADAIVQRNTTSLVNLSPLDSARIQSVATVKAGVGLGVDTVKAGVGLGVGTVKAGVGLGVGLVSSSVGMVSAIGSNTLSVLKAPLRSRTQSNNSPAPLAVAGDDLETSSTTSVGEDAVSDQNPSPQLPKRQSTAETMSKMVSSLYPFKSKDLHVVNHGGPDSSPELEMLLESTTITTSSTMHEQTDSESVTETSKSNSIDSNHPSPSPSRTMTRPGSNANIKSTLIGSLNSLRSLGTPQPPVTAESVQPSDIKSLLTRSF